LIVVPRPLPAAAHVAHRRAVFICSGVQAVARGGARSASKVTACGDRSVYGVGDSVAGLEARVVREEPQARNGSLCEHYRGGLVPAILDRRGSRKRTSQLNWSPPSDCVPASVAPCHLYAYDMRNYISDHASASSRSYGQRLELAEGTSPRGLHCHCTDKDGNIHPTPLHVCRVVLLLLKSSAPRAAG
jgi:hypothetical protein